MGSLITLEDDGRQTVTRKKETTGNHDLVFTSTSLKFYF